MSDLPYYVEDGELHVHWLGEYLFEDEDADWTDAGLFEIEEVNEDVVQRRKSCDELDARLAMEEAEKVNRLIGAIGQMYEALKRIAYEPHPPSDEGQLHQARIAENALPDLDVDVEETYGWRPKPQQPSRRDLR